MDCRSIARVDWKGAEEWPFKANEHMLAALDLGRCRWGWVLGVASSKYLRSSLEGPFKSTRLVWGVRSSLLECSSCRTLDSCLVTTNMSRPNIVYSVFPISWMPAT